MIPRLTSWRGAYDPILRICAYVLGGIWMYQGLVPKLLGPHADEISMIRGMGISAASSPWVANFGGIVELGLGLALFVSPRSALMYKLSIASVLGLSVVVVLTSPTLLMSAFNAVAINGAMLALALIALVRLRELSHES